MEKTMNKINLKVWYAGSYKRTDDTPKDIKDKLRKNNSEKYFLCHAMFGKEINTLKMYISFLLLLLQITRNLVA